MTEDQINAMLQKIVEGRRLFEEAVGKQALIDLENLLVRKQRYAT